MRQQRKTILVVEDHPPELEAIREVVSGLGLDLIVAADGAAAKEYLARAVPDVVCLELLLPDSSGYELCELIRSSPAHCDVPILVLSGRASPGDRAHALEVGADAFLIKPWLEDQLRARIEHLLDRRSRRARAAGIS